MTVPNTRQIENAILDIVCQGKKEALTTLFQYGLHILPVLKNHLSKDMPMDKVEKYERIIKDVMRNHLSGSVTGEKARELAQFQKDIGLLFKYKSYTIKASSPLGYSLFFQNAGEGFSFQQHVTHKTEVFHILKVHSGGFVFICDFRDWKKDYDRELFSAWLAGQPEDRYERFRFRPEPGDVFVIDRLRLVHTVMGCTLEEYATVSTDMVDRLHDQNASKPIPALFNRQYAEDRLRTVAMPRSTRLIEIGSSGNTIRKRPHRTFPWGQSTRLSSTPVISTLYSIVPQKTSDLQFDEQNAASIYVSQGQGRVLIGTLQEIQKLTPPSIPVGAGDLLMIPEGIYYGFLNEGSEPMRISEQRIKINIAFQ